MKNDLTQSLNYFVKTCLKKCRKISVEHTTILDTLLIPKLNEKEAAVCKGALTEKELNAAMMAMAQEKAQADWSKSFKVVFTLKLESYLVTIDIENAFDSLNYSFLMAVWKEFIFGPSSLEWIKAVLKIKRTLCK